MSFAEASNISEGSTVGVAPNNDIARYEADGVICMREVIDPAAAVRLLDEVDSSEDFRQNMNLSERLASYWECVLPLAAVAARLLRSREIRLYNDHLFVKEAGKSVATDWHQDLPFWPFAGEQIIAAWIALTPVRRTESAVHYVRGSHRHGRFYQPNALAMGDTRHPDYLAMEPCPDFFKPGRCAADDMLSWDMEPGDVLWHNGLTFHGAQANTSPTGAKRAGLTVRFLGDDVTWAPRPFFRAPEKQPAVSAGGRISGDDTFPLLWSSR